MKDYSNYIKNFFSHYKIENGELLVYTPNTKKNEPHNTIKYSPSIIAATNAINIPTIITKTHIPTNTLLGSFIISIFLHSKLLNNKSKFSLIGLVTFFDI